MWTNWNIKYSKSKKKGKEIYSKGQSTHNSRRNKYSLQKVRNRIHAAVIKKYSSKILEWVFGAESVPDHKFY